MTYTRSNERTLEIAKRALDAALSIAVSQGIVRWRLEEVQLHSNAFGNDIYAGGRESEPACGVVALGNWNEVTVRADGERMIVPHGDLPVRLRHVFETLGIECEWGDQHDTCCECGKLLRTDADSHSWRPYFHDTDDGRVCFDCEPEHMYPRTVNWLRNNDACREGKSFVGNRTLAEAVMDEDASEGHLKWLWEALELDDTHGFERTRELLRDACIEADI